MALLQRVAEQGRRVVHFTLDGRPAEALEGDTVLTAMLTNGERLRRSEFAGSPRAGFCLMGACQDCWVRTEEGERLRACGSFIADGMRLLSEGEWGGGLSGEGSS
ncbi:(2Fe-2S)-binding protein [Azospirillum picis]|uniref:Molibdopterin-dependent oxidoreductase YjgC n=1 Tax=Azospirillum picis TaxID=488438 RepID=A0ABU0MN04_9PROT|nr:(2Fe-2S)-binding protein [Azospirillum picis]MBP2301192.1 putative molibdopterin-dependent oxidoreductase YjgC [Azospirillum picis]MDQ0534845.1 putative molibdopterin-dependent oxidoreductase YjgC [Azospirillum picis]